MKSTTASLGSGFQQRAALLCAVQSGFVRGALTLAAVLSSAGISLADEGGVSFWLPGLYGSLAAVPPAAPGWSFYTFNYYSKVSAGADVSAAREIQIGRFTPTVTTNLSANLNARVDLQWLQPNYTFATPVIGGQLTLSLGGSSAGRTPTWPGR